MMRYCALLGFAFFRLPASAAEFCEDANRVLDSDTTWDFRGSFEKTYALPSHRGDQLYPTKAVLHLESSPEGSLSGRIDYPMPPGEAGLFYNIYRLQIEIGAESESDRQVIDLDYTAQCSAVGPGLGPNRHLDLPLVRIEPHADGSPRELEAVHVRFWGLLF